MIPDDPGADHDCAVLVNVNTGQTISFFARLSVGRDPMSGLCLTDGVCSWQHAVFVREGTIVYVRDLSSSNGTFINGSRLQGQTDVRPGMTIVFGDRRCGEWTIQAPVTSVRGEKTIEIVVHSGNIDVHVGVEGGGDYFRLWIVHRGLRTDLGTSKYYILLQELAAARHLDAANGVAEREQGWLDVEALRRRSGIDQIDTALCRVRDAFREAGIADYREVIEVRKGERSMPGLRRLSLGADQLFVHP